MELGRKSQKKDVFKKLLYLIALAIVIGGGIYLVPRFEWNAPTISITPDSEYVGLRPLEITIAEQGRGLKSLTVILSAAGTEHSLAAEQFDRGVMDKKLTITLSPKQSGLKEGPALLRIAARDRSYWSFFRGNQTVIEKNVIIDVTAPTVELIADDAYVNFGGSGLIVYKPSPDTARSGVKIGRYFFPGYKGQTKDPAAYVALFAHPYDVPEKEEAILVASDKAGNTKQVALRYTLKNVRYRKSTIPVSDSFIENKVAPLLGDPSSRPGSAKEIFVKVNREMRKENEDKIKDICQKSADSMLWNRPFVQLANSKVEANFADKRTYIYGGENIDQAYHLGYDLAVTKRHPVEASNSGIVAFAGDLGIYGNTVIIDHGLGLFTLYSHLSSIDVNVGDQLMQRQIIGKTGETGLAAGDHLHFATLIHGVPVLPLEWWDKKWIRDNIQHKLTDGDDGATAEQSRPRSKPRPRAAARKR